MTTSKIFTVSTGEALLTLDVNGKRYGTIVVPKSNITQYLAENMHKNIIIEGNTYGDKGAIDMFNYYKTHKEPQL
jgi:selenocysteine-specific translation elongation factor